MEQRERDESSSKLEEALRELTGAETKADVVNGLDDDDWEQEELEELDQWDEPEKSPRGMSRLAAAFRPSDDLLAAFFLPVVILILICIPRYFPLWAGKLPADGYVPPVCAVFFGIPA